MQDVLEGLYAVVQQRKAEPQEGSYTCYLFEKGLDKILKKCGEECSEVIIAAKNGVQEETVGEICDLLYHLLVMMAEQRHSFGSGGSGAGTAPSENRQSEAISCQ